MHMAVVLLQEYHELVSTFKRQEALLYQFSEEKVQLAQHALELITQYQKQLDEVRHTSIGMLCQKVIQAATVAWTAYCTELPHCRAASSASLVSDAEPAVHHTNRSAFCSEHLHNLLSTAAGCGACCGHGHGP